MNIPLFFASMVLFYFDKPFSSFIFFGLIGITNGLCNVLGSSTWAEIYGVKYIGSIKASDFYIFVGFNFFLIKIKEIIEI